jgi:hypothetical protein
MARAQATRERIAAGTAPNTSSTATPIPFAPTAPTSPTSAPALRQPTNPFSETPTTTATGLSSYATVNWTVVAIASLIAAALIALGLVL